MEVVVLVEVLHGALLVVDQADLLPRPEGAVHHPPEPEVLQLGADERAALAGLHVLEVDDVVRLSVELDLQALSKLRGRHLHRLPSWPPRGALRPSKVAQARAGRLMIRLPDDDPAEHRRGLVGEPLRQAEVAERDRRVRIVDEQRPDPAPVRRDPPRDARVERPGQSLHTAVVRIQRGQAAARAPGRPPDRPPGGRPRRRSSAPARGPARPRGTAGSLPGRPGPPRTPRAPWRA